MPYRSFFAWKRTRKPSKQVLIASPMYQILLFILCDNKRALITSKADKEERTRFSIKRDNNKFRSGSIGVSTYAWNFMATYSLRNGFNSGSQEIYFFITTLNVMMQWWSSHNSACKQLLATTEGFYLSALNMSVFLPIAFQQVSHITVCDWSRSL